MKLFLSIFMFFMVSCSDTRQQSDISAEGFQPPVIVEASNFDSVEAWKPEGINEVFPRFVGQYKFLDTVRIGERVHRNITQDEAKWESRAFDFDTLSVDGLEIYPDYGTTIRAKHYDGAPYANTYFPVYILNETKSAKLFIGKDSYAFAIQEAIDTDDYDKWYAIEAKGFDFCGNGYFRRKLMPQEFIMILMPKYQGADTTYIRTRIKNGESVLVSKPYKGVIDKKQFATLKGSWLSKEVKETSDRGMFYGANNKE